MENLSPTQLIELWRELFSALYNNNSYGGDVAEIYIYPFSRYLHAGDTDGQVENAAEANRAIYEACRMFEKANRAVITFDSGQDIGLLTATPNDPFLHRIHLKVAKA